jgi:hypothetical protein
MLIIRITGKAKDVFGALGALTRKHGSKTLGQIVKESKNGD